MADLRSEDWYSDKVFAKVTNLDPRYAGSPIVVNINGYRFQIGDGSEVLIPRTVASTLAATVTVSDVGGKKIEKPVYGVFINDQKKQKVADKADSLLGKPIK